MRARKMLKKGKKKKGRGVQCKKHNSMATERHTCVFKNGGRDETAGRERQKKRRKMGRRLPATQHLKLLSAAGGVQSRRVGEKLEKLPKGGRELPGRRGIHESPAQ